MLSCLSQFKMTEWNLSVKTTTQGGPNYEVVFVQGQDKHYSKEYASELRLYVCFYFDFHGI